MAFDIEGAKKAGYSDTEIADHLAQEKGFDLQGARKSGYADADIVKHLTMLPAAKPSASGSADAIGSVVNTISEPVVSMATGTGGAVAGGLAGIAGAVLPGPQGQGRDWAAKVQNALTYEPRSAGGKALLHAVNTPFEWLAGKAGQAGQFVMDKTGSPVAATATDVAINALPMAAGGLVGRSKLAAGESPEAVAARQAAQVRNAPKDAALAQAREYGYRVTPTDAGAGGVLGAVEGLAGEPKTAKLMSKKNAALNVEMAKKDVGIPADVPLTRQAVADVRTEAGKAYDAIKNTGTVVTDAKYAQDLKDITKSYDTAAADFSHRSENPFQKTLEGLQKESFNATSAVEEVKLLRKDADKAFRTGDSELGRAFKKAAQALDDMLDRHVSKLGNPEIAAQYQAARTLIAKTYTLDKALTDAGTIKPDVYAKRLADKKPLSGPGLVIGETAANFPRSMQRVERLGSTGPTIFDVLGAVAGKDALLLGARPLTRELLAANPINKLFTKPGEYDRSTLSFAREEAAKKAGLLGLMGAANGQ